LGKAKLHTVFKREGRTESARGEEKEVNLEMSLEKKNARSHLSLIQRM